MASVFRFFVTVVFLMSGSFGRAVCRDAEILEPATKSTVVVAQPVIVWRPIVGVSDYRVEVESRMPEGRVLVSLDTQLSGTSLRLPQALTDSRAGVKVRVTAGCPADGGSRLREQAASFYIDTSPLCPVPERIQVSSDRRSIEWSATEKATRYDVTLLRPDGTVVRQAQTQRRTFPLPDTGDTLVATVRPYCATGFGRVGSALITPQAP
jgi:hypothetical protein